MKTVSQIMEYLDKQSWKNEFFKYANTTLFFNEKLLSRAFVWSETPQGYAFWNDINNKYSIWYSTEEKVKSWEEFKKSYPILAESPINYMEQFAAYKKLILLRDQWIKATNLISSKKTCKIVCDNNKLAVLAPFDEIEFNGLSFPETSMAIDFLNIFEDLINEAKSLL